MSTGSKRADELLSALAGEFELLGAEKASLARELECLRKQLNDGTTTNASVFRQSLPTPGPSLLVVPCSKSGSHLCPLADASHGQVENPGDFPPGFSELPRACTELPRACSKTSATSPNTRSEPMENAVLNFMNTNSDLHIEERYENLYDLSRVFNTLCAKNKITVSARELCEMDLNQQGQSTHAVDIELEAQFREAIVELNKDLGLSTSTSKLPSQEVMLETYALIMSGEKAESKLECAGKDAEVIEAMSHIRDILLKEDAIRKIALATNTGAEDIYVSNKNLGSSETKMEKCLRYFDPFVGLVILCNAVVIGVSTDWYVGSVAWDWCEFFFTVIFFLDILVKVHVYGFSKHFCGHDMLWNVFDFLVVIIAVAHLIVTLLSDRLMLGNVTLVRLIRFARLTKLVRVLKLKVFKELALLVNGCFAGFRTLLWAMVFLAFILFAVGIVVKDLFGRPTPVYYPRCPNPILFPKEAALAENHEACFRSAAKLDEHRIELFGSVPRSMFSMFRCFTDGCSLPDGTPVVPNFYNTHGLLLVLIYTLCVLFVTFGLFNLIMAVFVENTIENAKRDEERRREARTHEHIRVARKLQEVILLFCAGEPDNNVLSDTKRCFRSRSGSGSGDEQTTGILGWFKRVFSTRWTLRERPRMLSSRWTLKDRPFQGVDTNSNLSLNVSQAAFHKLLEKPEVKQMLDDLDIGYSSRGALFDVLDANCNGVLEVSELVQGLLKLRGATEKGDVVASLLAIRSLQRNMKALELLGLRQQTSIDSLNTAQERLESQVRKMTFARPSLLPGTGCGRV